MRYIVKQLSKVKDPRQEWKVKHSLVSILAICIVAIMCGATTVEQISEYGRQREEWFRGFLSLDYGIPSRLTINRVLSMLDGRKFSYVFTSIMQHIKRLSKGAIVSLDGKSYLTPREDGSAKHALYVVNAWCNENNTILGELRVGEKTNEITAIPELLDILDIKDCVVTIDAIGCQKEIVRQIVEKEADYVIALKENQPSLSEEMREYVEFCLQTSSMLSAYSSTTTIEKGHGRIEKREYYLFNDLSWFESLDQWTGLKSVLMVRSTRQQTGKNATTECRFYITSLTDVEEGAKAIRSHWGIENKLHWSLDVLFREDRWRTQEKDIAANLDTLRKLALTFLRKAQVLGTEKMSGPTKMWACLLNPSLLNAFLFDSNVFPS